MGNENGRQRKPDSKQITGTVDSWPEIVVGSGRFGSTSFQLVGSEIGHLRPRLADINYPIPLREQLIADGLTVAHHAVPQHPTGTTFRLDSVGDVDRAIWLFRLSYLVHVAVLQQSREAKSALASLHSSMTGEVHYYYSETEPGNRVIQQCDYQFGDSLPVRVIELAGKRYNKRQFKQSLQTSTELIEGELLRPKSDTADGIVLSA